jgi:hypothetical protein
MEFMEYRSAEHGAQRKSAFGRTDNTTATENPKLVEVGLVEGVAPAYEETCERRFGRFCPESL